MSNNRKAIKSGVWYTVANFLIKGIGFLTTPIFARVLSKTDYGLFSNYSSWLSTFTIIMTLGLGSTFISARFDFEDDFDNYVSSSLVLSTIITASWGLLFIIFNDFFSQITGIEKNYLYIMIVYLIFYSAVDMFQAKERFLYGYKKTVLISLIVAASTAGLSVFLVSNLDNKLAGRIIGSALPTILVGMILYCFLLQSGKTIKHSYWKYAIPICLPYIPHVLSLTLLNMMDKVMITKICGPADNALYSLAYSCGALITLVATSINSAFSPWLGEKLNSKSYDEIYSVSSKYILIFTFATCGIMLITPEILMLMGGKSYLEAIYVMPPVSFGCVCQFIYSMYVSVEQFNKKTVGMACASSLAALSNYILNAIFIEKYGYIAAAYTTLASYFLLLLMHVWLVSGLQLGKIYPLRKIIIVLVCMSVYTVLINMIYKYTWIRLMLVVGYIIMLFIVYKHYREQIMTLLKKEKR